MPKFFFHMEDHAVMHDHEGIECEDGEAARGEAVRRFSGLIASRPQDVWDGMRWRMVIAEESGRILWTLELHAEKGVNVVPWSKQAGWTKPLKALNE